LKQVVCHLPVPGKEEKVPHQSVLKSNDELVEQPGVLSLKSFSDSKILLSDLLLDMADTAGGEQGSNGPNRTHLDQLDDRQLPEAAKKITFAPKIHRFSKSRPLAGHRSTKFNFERKSSGCGPACDS
jgi:hypothetical protein